MTTKEKAKRFDEALEQLKGLIEGTREDKCAIVEEDIIDIFPELAESEDERIIRNRIYNYINVTLDDNESEEKEKWLAWLEKQKPIEHFELKAGHWYICHRPYCCRADHLTVKEGEKFMCEKDGVAKGFIIKDPEKYFKESNPPAPMEEDITWLEKQGENSPVLSNSSKTVKEWTEEDEKNWRGIIDEIEANKSNAPDYDIETYDRFLSWLDNIKQRLEQ